MLQFAIFGAGRMGQIHAGSLLSREDCSVRYIVDPVSQNADALARKTKARVASADEVFGDPAVDAVIIASFADTHGGYIRAAIGAKKAVFTEKPLVRDLAEAREIVDLAAKNQTDVFVGFNRRYDPSFRRLKSQLDAGAIGRPELIVLTSRDPEHPALDYIASSGGLFRNSLIHDFDIARWLLGEEPVQVYAVGSNFGDPKIRELESPDTAAVVMKTARGAVCVINISWRAEYGYDQRVEVLGKGGMLQVGNLTPTSVVQTSPAGVVGEKPLYFFPERYAQSYRDELMAFVDTVRTRANWTTAFDGLRALTLADAAHRSWLSGNPVALS